MKIILTQEEINEILLEHLKGVLISTDIHPLEYSEFFIVCDQEGENVNYSSVEFAIEVEDKS